MPRSPTGVYSLPAGNPVVTLTKIRTTWANPTMSDIGTTLTDSWSRSGQGAALANLPMGGFKFLNVDDATNATDFARADQVQTSSLWAVTTPAGADDYTGNLPLGTTLFTEGQIITIVFPVTNTGDATLALNAGTANSIRRFDGEELFAGDIHPNIPSLLIWSDILTSWILLSSDTMPFVATGTPTFNTGGGVDALISLTTGEANTAFGAKALENLTTGDANTAGGAYSLNAAVIADQCTAYGYQSLQNNLANANSAFGVGALANNTTGEGNCAFGHLACETNLDADFNSGFGFQALGGASANLGYNAAHGYHALYNCEADYNAALGARALENLTTETNCSGIGKEAAITGSNQVQLGNSATTTYAYGAVQNRSDRRDKADIRDTVLGLDFIKALKPVDFKWDYREDYVEGDSPGSKVRNRYHHGFIAQDVADLGFGGYQDHSLKGGKDVLSLGYQEFIAPLVKAVQELSAQVEALKRT